MKQTKTGIIITLLLALTAAGWGCSEAKVPSELKVGLTSMPGKSTTIPIEPGQTLRVKNLSDKLLNVYKARTDSPVTIVLDTSSNILTVKQGTKIAYYALPVMWEIETLPN